MALNQTNMFKKKKNKNDFTWEREIGSFRIGVTPLRVDVETKSKDVKWTFLLGTKQYYHFRSYYEAQEWKLIEYLVKTMYNVLLIFSDAELSKEINKLISDSMPRLQALADARSGKDQSETDDEILEQEKFKEYEKTERAS